MEVEIIKEVKKAAEDEIKKILRNLETFSGCKVDAVGIDFRDSVYEDIKVNITLTL